jgi:hypothetical protein
LINGCASGASINRKHHYISDIQCRLYLDINRILHITMLRLTDPPRIHKHNLMLSKQALRFETVNGYTWPVTYNSLTFANQSVEQR